MDDAGQGEEIGLNSTATGNQFSPEVTELSDGRMLATFISYFDEAPSDSATRARVIGADGQPEGADFVVNATDLGFSHACPAVKTLAEGNAPVVWHSSDVGDGDWGCLRGRLLNSDGQPVSLDVVINATMMNNQSSPALQALADGRVLVT